jgi:hypothetical protein
MSGWRSAKCARKRHGPKLEDAEHNDLPHTTAQPVRHPHEINYFARRGRLSRRSYIPGQDFLALYRIETSEAKMAFSRLRLMRPTRPH